MRWPYILLLVLVSWWLGARLQRVVEAQNPGLVMARDSVSGATVMIQTDGSNALKVVGQ